MNSNILNYYSLLDVAHNASIDDMKKAFRRLAHRFHPDKNPGDREMEEKFKEICNAYEVLTDPQKRLMYDRTGLDCFAGSGPGVYTHNNFNGTHGGMAGGERKCGRKGKGGCCRRRSSNEGSWDFFIRINDTDE